MVDFLIGKGADIHAKDDQPLRISARNGHLDVVRLLVEKYGANIRADNDQPLILSAMNGHLAVVKYLVGKWAHLHANNNDALKQSAASGHLDVVRFLIENGADIHADNDAALKYSAEFGHANVVRYLVENGANVHADNGAYCLSYVKGHTEIAAYLLECMSKPLGKPATKTVKISKTTELEHYDAEFGFQKLMLLENFDYELPKSEFYVAIGKHSYRVVNETNPENSPTIVIGRFDIVLPIDTPIKLCGISAKLAAPIKVRPSGITKIILPKNTCLRQSDVDVKYFLADETEANLV